MSPLACPSCGQRRGRRQCPALGAQICTVCCGSKRLTEIRCPSDCAYLTTARLHPPAVVQRRREVQGRFLATIVDGLTQPQYQLFLLLQIAVADHVARAAAPAPRGSDIAEAAGTLAATYETASKGIIYEHHATGLPAQRVAADLRAAIEAIGREGRMPRDADLAAVLRRTERAAREADAALNGDDAYRSLLADLFPGAGAAGASSRLVIP
jgi:hypothetical protein